MLDEKYFLFMNWLGLGGESRQPSHRETASPHKASPFAVKNNSWKRTIQDCSTKNHYQSRG